VADPEAADPSAKRATDRAASLRAMFPNAPRPVIRPSGVDETPDDRPGPGGTAAASGPARSFGVGGPTPPAAGSFPVGPASPLARPGNPLARPSAGPPPTERESGAFPAGRESGAFPAGPASPGATSSRLGADGLPHNPHDPSVSSSRLGVSGPPVGSPGATSSRLGVSGPPVGSPGATSSRLGVGGPADGAGSPSVTSSRLNADGIPFSRAAAAFRRGSGPVTPSVTSSRLGLDAGLPSAPGGPAAQFGGVRPTSPEPGGGAPAGSGRRRRRWWVWVVPVVLVLAVAAGVAFVAMHGLSGVSLGPARTAESRPTGGGAGQVGGGTGVTDSPSPIVTSAPAIATSAAAAGPSSPAAGPSSSPAGPPAPGTAPAVAGRVNASGVNLALRKTAVASSLESRSWPAADAVDGDLSTRWSSGWADPQWIRVDLGALWQVSDVRLAWEHAYAVKYHVDISVDGKKWTTVYKTAAGTDGLRDIPVKPSPARYVRIIGQERNSTYGYSLQEFEVR